MEIATFLPIIASIAGVASAAFSLSRTLRSVRAIKKFQEDLERKLQELGKSDLAGLERLKIDLERLSATNLEGLNETEKEFLSMRQTLIKELGESSLRKAERAAVLEGLEQDSRRAQEYYLQQLLTPVMQTMQARNAGKR